MTVGDALAHEGTDGYLFPLSFAQARLWILDQIAPGSTAYTMRCAVRLRQEVDPAVLERAFNVLVERHETLRTVFRVQDDEPRQLVRPSMQIRLRCCDLTALPPGRREAAATALAVELAEQPFDLGAGPLLRTMLIRLGANDHILVIAVHHIVADGWSMGVLAGELGVVYEGLLVGRGVGLSALVVQYADFAVWQREWLAGERLAEQVAFWRGALEGCAGLALPLDRPRPLVQAHRGAAVEFGVSGEVLSGLSGVARESQATVFMVVFAGFAVVLGRWCGQDDVVVGAPTAGRTRAELEGLIGFFVNTLVLRVDLSGDPSLGEVVRRVREVALGAYAHADLPFERLVEELAPQRDLSRNPVFQVTFQLFESPTAPDAVSLQGGLEVPVTSSLFDLRFDLWPAASGLAGRVEFDTDLFDRQSIEWLVERFGGVLEQLAAEPARRLSELWLLPAGQRQLLERVNETAAPIPAGLVHDAVAARTAQAPDARAVADADGAFSYAELDAHANGLAWRLDELGVERGALVALCLERGRHFTAAALGTLRAGGAYLPLDPAYPPARLDHVLADAEPAVLVTSAALAERLHAAETTRTLLIDPWPATAEAPPARELDPTDAAYVIYTSGSTGTPKGVVVEHRSLMNLIAWHRHAYAITPTDHCSQIASVGFDAACWELWPSLTAGAQLEICDDATRADADALLRWLDTYQITVAFIPTPLAELLLTRRWPATSPLRYLLTGGDTLRRYANPDHPYTLVNHYGPTESTVVTTATEITASETPGRLPAIGRPIANTTIYIVDHHQTPAPPGTPGELWIGGESLARGYHHDPDLTRDRFIDNPFHPHPPRLYRTGDLVRLNPHGTLDFLGRTDTQIKIRGYRIEPREIETLLHHHPQITHAIVTTHTDPTTHTPHLTAHITTDSPALTGSGVRSWLKTRLPEPMVPGAIAVLDRFPLTAHGKIDYDALPEPEPVAAHEHEGDEPADALEDALCRIWADALRRDRIGVHDDFFEHGGHSLLAMQVVSRVRDAFHYELPLRTLFERPTTADVAALLRREAGPAERLERSAQVLIRVLSLSDADVETLLREPLDAEAGTP
jgi:amino acid adenylation domain-containing protein